MALQFGTVITFKEEVTQKEAVEAIKDLVAKGLIHPNTKLYQFENRCGGPVWYIP